MIIKGHVINNASVWSPISILTMRYGDNLGYLYQSISKTVAETDEIVEEVVSVGMGC